MRKVFGETCNIRVKTRFPEVDAAAYDVPVSACVENVIVDQMTTKQEKIGMIFRLMKHLNTKYLDKSGDYTWADVVVSCGGGFLLTHGLSIMTLQHLLQIKAAFDHKKPVVIYSQSIGPFYNKFIKYVAAKVLRKVNKIYVREMISLKWLEEMGIKRSVEVVPDSAFCMDMEPSERADAILSEVRGKHVGPIVGLTVRDWNFPEVGDSDHYRLKYVKSVSETILFLEQTYGAKVLLMPQVLGPNPFNDDRNISREILKFSGAKYAELLDYDLPPRQLKYLYSGVDMFIGTRMHSNIFALSSCVPTVAINYEHKTRGIMEMLGLIDYVVDINDITTDILVDMARRCWEKKDDLRTYLKNKIPDVVSDAALPAYYLREFQEEEARTANIA
ncbi:polysaccharide pyruvyl transferase family protein [Paenibacillus sp. TRM 82003]|nr:polysaccharide pyruvyl transferase family protein [Paenibacillus sp. TRM 82003]